MMKWLKGLGKKKEVKPSYSTFIAPTQYTSIQFQELQNKVHANALKKGFWKDYAEVQLMKPVLKEEVYLAQYLNCVGQRLMLIASEVGEAEEALRTENMYNFQEEVADIVIRCMDLAGGLGFDLFEEIQRKHQYNLSRKYKHGKSF